MSTGGHRAECRSQDPLPFAFPVAVSVSPWARVSPVLYPPLLCLLGRPETDTEKDTVSRPKLPRISLHKAHLFFTSIDATETQLGATSGDLG
jgi:hypothetical protein